MKHSCYINSYYTIELNLLIIILFCHFKCLLLNVCLKQRIKMLMTRFYIF